MKLHLPKRLLTALLAAFTVVSISTPCATQGMTLTDGYHKTLSLSESWSYTANDGNTVEYNAASGKFTGYDLEKNTLTLNMQTSWAQNEANHLICVDANVSDSGEVTGKSNVSVGLYANGNGTISGSWSGSSWNATQNNGNIPSATLTSYGQYVSLTVAIAKAAYDSEGIINGVRVFNPDGSNEHLYNRTDLRGSNTTYNGSVSSYLNSNLIDAIVVKNTTEYKDPTKYYASNFSGSWAEQFDKDSTLAVMSAGAATEVTSSTDLSGKVAIVVGGASQLRLNAAESPLVLNDRIDLYIGRTSYQDNTDRNNNLAAIRFDNTNNVAVNGDIYIVDNATLLAAGSSDITIAGKVTDKVEDASGNVISTASLLTLKGSGYNFTGEVDVHGLHIAAGAQAAFNNLKVDGTLTNNGTLVLNSTVRGSGTVTSEQGRIELGAYTLNLFDVTYVNGGNSGFVDSLTVFSNQAVYTGKVYVDNVGYDVREGTIILGGDSKTYYVNEANYTVTDDAAGATVCIAENASLNRETEINAVIVGNGVYNLGANSTLGSLSLDDENWKGAVQIGGTDVYYTFSSPDNQNKADLNYLDKLVTPGSRVILKGVKGWVQAGTNPGDAATISANIELENLSETVYAWSINDGYSKDNTNQTGRYTKFTGNFSGSGDIVLSKALTLEYRFYGDLRGWTGNFMVEDSGGNMYLSMEEAANTINAGINKKNGSIYLTVNTTDAATFANAVSVNALTLNQSATFTGSLTATTISVASGKTLTLDNGTTTLGATISGAGGLIKSGTGTLTLSGANTYSGGTTISGGEVILTSASALSSGSYTISKDTKLTLKEANYSITNLISGEGELVVEKGTTLTLALGNNPNGKKFGANIRIKDGGRLQATDLNATDQLDYNVSRTVYLEGSAELALEDTRQTVGNWTFDMTGGTISGRGVSGNLHALDFHKTGSIKAHAAAGATADAPTVSTVSASIKNRENGQLNLIVDENARLDLTGNLNLARPVEKSGDGLAVIKGTVSSLGEMKVTAGTLELQSSANTGSALTVSSGAEFEISAGTSTLSGAVTNNGAITVSGGSATLSGAVTNSGAMTVSGGTATLSGAVTNSGSITVSSGSVDFTGAFTANAANASLTQSGTGVVNLNGDITVATGAGLTLNGVVGIGSTITNNGTLTFTNSITIAGELSSFDTYDNGSEGQVTYVGVEGNARLDGNGFEKVSGLSYRLTSEDSTGRVIYDGVTKVSHGANTYTLGAEGNNLYFTVTSNIGHIFFVRSAAEAAEINEVEASHATGFDICEGGSLSLAAGAETNANATIRLAGNSSINLAAGSTLHAFTKEGSGSITLTGSGTYNLGSSTAANVSGLQNSTNWTGTVKLSDVVASGMDFETYGNVASKVVLNGVSGWFDRATNNNVHIILEEKGLTFSDFSTDDNYTFAKGISGTGNFVIDADNTKTVSSTPTIRIGVNEDATLTWSGKFQVNDIWTDSVANPGNAFVRLYLNGNGSYFDSTAASAGVEMNDSVGTLKVFVGHATGADNAKEVTDYTPGDGLTTINGSIKNNSTGRLELTALNNTVFNKEVAVTSMTVNSGKTATMNSTLNAGTLNLGETATITTAKGKTAATMQNVKLSDAGIDSADETQATKGSVADAKVTLDALAEGTSFSIEDVTLTNVNIEAENADDRVNLSGLSASAVQLTKGEFHMLDKPQVGTGGSAINLVEGGSTGLDFSTSLLNGMTLGEDASMVVDLGDLSGFTGMDSGKPTFSITLEGFSLSDYTGTGENKGLYFAADSWLGQLLVAQGASQYVKGDSLEAGAQAAAGSGSGVSVSYNPTSVGTGTVIIISGLKVPEPATSTLGLIALTALVSRRRRK